MANRSSGPVQQVGSAAFRWMANSLFPAILLGALGVAGTSYLQLHDLRIEFEYSKKQHELHSQQQNQRIKLFEEQLLSFMEPGDRWTKSDGLETRRQLEKFSEYVREYIEDHSDWGRGIVGEWGANIKHLQECCRRFNQNNRNH